MTLKAVVRNLPKKYEGYGFAGMIENDFNRSFIATAKEYLRGEIKKKSLTMCGRVGTGKTRLAVAILRNLKPIMKDMIISKTDAGTKKIPMLMPMNSIYVSATEFFQRCNEAVSSVGSKMDYINNLLLFDIVLLDELRTENFTPAKQENLALFVNQAYVNERTIFITTNFMMEELEKIDPPTTDRLNEMSLIMKFEGESFR